MKVAQRIARFLLPVLLVLGLGEGWKLAHPPKKPPFEISFWVWQGPFNFTKGQVLQLQNLGVRQLFVRAGTFTSDGDHLFLKYPQRWVSKSSGLGVHLVFNFDGGVVAHFSHFDVARMAEEIRIRIEAQIVAARTAGVDVHGVQFDFDVPSSQLRRYAMLLEAIRSGSALMRRGGALQVSCTGLVSWLRWASLQTVSRQLDFIAPQFYEGSTGKTLDQLTPISDLEVFRQNVTRANSLACPYFVGIPSYGHALLFDTRGKLQALYSGLSPSDALRHPAFQFEAAFPSDSHGRPAATPSAGVGEEVLKLKAIRSDRSGNGLGYTLAYTIPNPELLQRYLEVAKGLQSERCLGAIIYRYPEPGQSLALPMPTVEAVVKGHAPGPNLQVTISGAADTYDLIDSEAKSVSAPMDVYANITNSGDAPTFVAPDAVRLTVSFDQGGFDEVRRREMDSVAQIDDHTLEFRKGFLAPGETVHVGPIRLLGQAKKTTVSWRVRNADGFRETKGEVRDQTISPK